MTLSEVMQTLEGMGSPGIKKIFLNHGASEPLFGVKVGDLKTIVKKVKKNHELSLALYDTGNADAMYLAGLIADEKKITPDDLRRWAEQSNWYSLSEYTVAWVAAESPHGWDLALEWIDSPSEKVASSGWSALSSWVTIRPNDQLDMPALTRLLERVGDRLHDAPNRVRYTMNGFIIACGISVPELTDKANTIAARVGKVNVELGGTACKVPDATDYIKNAIDKGYLGHKKKVARC